MSAPASVGSGDLGVILAIARVTVRALLARRRAILMGLLALVPVLVALLVAVRAPGGGSPARASGLLENLVITTVLPLIALVFGTSAIGAELEDGSAIHLLTKPVARWRIVAAKLLAAAPVAAGLVAIAVLPSGLVAGGGLGLTLAYVVGLAVGALVYVALFLALSIATSRALILGLGYIALWEGALAGLFEGTRILSVRQYTTSIVAGLDPARVVATGDELGLAEALIAAGIVFALAFLFAARRLARRQLTAGD